jgi:integration host factor subunit beta
MQVLQKVMYMDKLIANLAARFPDLTDDDVSLAVDTIINAMSAQLISGGRIELRRFGSFSLNAKSVGTCSNEVHENDPESSVVIFKPGQVIREKVNNAA